MRKYDLMAAALVVVVALAPACLPAAAIADGTKISAMTELAAEPADDDEFAVVDTSETETKRITWSTVESTITAAKAAALKSPATTGVTTVTGPAAGETRAKTVRDADDTLLELGGSYTPSGTWVWTSATVTWPTGIADNKLMVVDDVDLATAQFLVSTADGAEGKTPAQAMAALSGQAAAAFSFGAQDVTIGGNGYAGGVVFTADATHGGAHYKVYAASSGTLAGTSDTIELAIPSGWRILQCQLHVKTAVTDDGGDDTWSAELYDGGTEESIVAGAAAAQNTGVDHWADEETTWTLTDAETDILLTPNGGSFSAGEIEAWCLAVGFAAWSAE